MGNAAKHNLEVPFSSLCPKALVPCSAGDSAAGRARGLRQTLKARRPPLLGAVTPLLGAGRRLGLSRRKTWSQRLSLEAQKAEAKPEVAEAQRAEAEVQCSVATKEACAQAGAFHCWTKAEVAAGLDLSSVGEPGSPLGRSFFSKLVSLEQALGKGG